MNEVFSEYFARRKNVICEIDSRIKIVFVVAAILAVLSSRTLYAPLIVIPLALICLLCLRVPLKVTILRLSAPIGIAIMILLIKIFFCHDSIAAGVLIFLKIIASTSLLLFLSMTTTLDKLLSAGRWFKMPAVWIEIALIAYRYIFVLCEDAVTVFDAQRLRLGYNKIAGAMQCAGTLAGAVIVRAYDQSIATYEAMMLRGYKGKLEISSCKERFTLKDVLAIGLFTAILILLISINWISAI